MKKTYLISALCLGILILTSSYSSIIEHKSKKNALTIVSNTIPDNIQKIFKISCMDCHGSHGKGMAISKLNFSGWDSYSPEKQEKKAKAICNMLTSGKMPPKSYRKSHPGAIPSALQINEICEWSKLLNSRK